MCTAPARQLGFAIAVMAMPAAGLAQPIDCNSDALNQSQMNQCAYADYERADRDLNAVYARVRAAMRERDSEMEPRLRGIEKALIEGQRGWIAYRDGHCAVAGSDARGGSMEPLLVAGCTAALTEARTKELSDLI